MYTAKTGKKFGSAFAGRKYDEMHKEGPDSPEPKAKDKFAGKGPNRPAQPKASKAHEAKESPDFEAGEQEGAQEGVETPENVVAQHGKATSVHIKHDHVANKHHVTSMHEDGHVHESDHATPQEAHQAAATLGGEPAAQQAESEAGPEANDGFQMPDLGA